MNNGNPTEKIPDAACGERSTMSLDVARAGLAVVCDQWELYCAVVLPADRDVRFAALEAVVPSLRRQMAGNDATRFRMVELPAAWLAILFFTCTQNHPLLSDLRMAIVPALSEWESAGTRQVPKALIADA